MAKKKEVNKKELDKGLKDRKEKGAVIKPVSNFRTILNVINNDDRRVG